MERMALDPSDTECAMYDFNAEGLIGQLAHLVFNANTMNDITAN